MQYVVKNRIWLEGGGGTQATEAGLKTIENFKKLEKKCQDFLTAELNKLHF